MLELTITDLGPSGFGSSGVQCTFSNSDYSWTDASGKSGTTTQACVSSEPLPGDSTIVTPYVSDPCDINNLSPGQSASGYVFFAVPDKTAVVEVVEPEPDTPLVVLDPENIVKQDSVKG